MAKLRSFAQLQQASPEERHAEIERVLEDFYAQCRPLLEDETWERDGGRDSVDIDLTRWLERRRT